MSTGVFDRPAKQNASFDEKPRFSEIKHITAVGLRWNKNNFRRKINFPGLVLTRRPPNVTYAAIYSPNCIHWNSMSEDVP